MGIKISQGFTRTGKFPIDETLLLTKAQMLGINDNLMPEKYFTLCLDDGKFYIYNKSATPSTETGKFTVFEGGSSDYNDLINQPTLEGKVIKGDMSLSDFGILNEDEVEDLIDSKITDSEGNFIFYTKDETYSKEEVYTKEEVDDLIELLPKFEIKIVEELPTKDISTTTIYLVPRQDSEGSNVYEEYIYVDKKWELIGTTDIDLSDYYTISEVDTLLDEKQDVLIPGSGINIENDIISVDDTEIATKNDIDYLEDLLDSEGNRITALEDELDNLEIPYFETTFDSEGNSIVNIISGDSSTSVSFNDSENGYIVSVDDGITEASKELVSKEYVDEVAGQEHVELTQAEYDALPPEKKLDGTIYFVTDGEGGESGGGTIGEDFTTNITVGGIASGTQITQDETLASLIKRMLTTVYYPTFIDPSATLSYAVNKLQKVGTNIASTLASITFNPGEINLQGIKQANRAGNAVSYSISTSGATTEYSDTNTTGQFNVASLTRTTKGNIAITGSVSYEQGPQPKDSDGNDYNHPLVAGSVNTSNIVIEFIQPFYFGSSSSSTISDFTGLEEVIQKKGEKSYTYTTNNQYMAIAYDSSYGSLTSILDPNNFEAIDGWETALLNVNNLEYRVYITKSPSTNPGAKYTFKF